MALMLDEIIASKDHFKMLLRQINALKQLWLNLRFGFATRRPRIYMVVTPDIAAPAIAIY